MDREALIDILIAKPQHKISANSQGGYDCKCGARWDWQKWEKEEAERHAAGYLADAILAEIEQAHTPTDDERRGLIERAAEAFDRHDGAPTWQDDPKGRDAALRWHMRGFEDGVNARRTVQGTPVDDELARNLAETYYPSVAPEAGEPEYPKSALRRYMQGAFISGWSAHRTVQGEPTSEAANRGTFGHVWPCPLFYVGNWKRIENGHESVRECTTPAACAPAPVQGEPLDAPTVQYMARRGGKTQATIDRMLAQANERGIRVEVVYPQTEPTDASVEAGCIAFYEHASGLTSWSRLVEYDTVLADRYRDGIRRALRAAFATNQEENR